jgi:imidazolonepropionase-like amidohydrolase
VPRRIPTLPNKFRQLRESGVTLLVGTDSGIPLNFHFDSTWRELDWFVRLGVPPMEALRAATYWPAQFLKQPDLGTIAAGKLADVIVVDGDPLTDMSSMRNVVHVVKDGKVYK